MPCRDLSLLVVHRYLEGVLGGGVCGVGCGVWVFRIKYPHPPTNTHTHTHTYTHIHSKRKSKYFAVSQGHATWQSQDVCSLSRTNEPVYTSTVIEVFGYCAASANCHNTANNRTEATPQTKVHLSIYMTTLLWSSPGH